MLRMLARDLETFGSLAPRLSDDHFQTVRNRELFGMLVSAGGDVGAEVARTGDDKVVRALSALALEPLQGEPSGEYAEDVWARLQEFVLKRKSASLRAELQKMNPISDPRYDELFQRLIGVDGELRRLRDRRHVPA